MNASMRNIRQMRDQIAVVAMGALISVRGPRAARDGIELAREAYDFADAMLSESEMRGGSLDDETQEVIDAIDEQTALVAEARKSLL